MQGLEEFSDFCPYCGENITVEIDTSEYFQQYYQDCQVCCAAIFYTITVGDENIEVILQRDDE